MSLQYWQHPSMTPGTSIKQSKIVRLTISCCTAPRCVWKSCCLANKPVFNLTQGLNSQCSSIVTVADHCVHCTCMYECIGLFPKNVINICSLTYLLVHTTHKYITNSIKIDVSSRRMSVCVASQVTVHSYLHIFKWSPIENLLLICVFSLFYFYYNKFFGLRSIAICLDLFRVLSS